MGFGGPTNLSHLLRDGLALRIICACGHIAEPDVLTLRSAMWMERKGEDLKDLPDRSGAACAGSSR